MKNERWGCSLSRRRAGLCLGFFTTLFECVVSFDILYQDIILTATLTTIKKSDRETRTRERLHLGFHAHVGFPLIGRREILAFDKLLHELVDMRPFRAVILNREAQNATIEQRKADPIYILKVRTISIF